MHVAITDRLDRIQERRPWLALPLAVVKRYGEHNGGRLSAAIAYFSFFSLFPLLLVFVSVLDIVIGDRPDLRDDIADSVLGNIPLIGTRVESPATAISGNYLTVGVGIATALWAGMGAVVALEGALNTVWDVRPSKRPNFLFARLRALGVLLALLVGVTATFAVGSLGRAIDLGVLAAIGTLLANAALNVLGMLVVFRLLTATSDPWRHHLPGAVVGGLAVFALQQLGGALADRYVANASDTYGTFAVVIGLLVWLHFVSQAIVLSAELNAVTARDLTPRTLGDEISDADRRAMLLNIERVRHEDELAATVAVPADRAPDGRDLD